MARTAARFQEEIDESELADLSPELRSAVRAWLAAGLVSVPAVLAFAEFMRKIASEMLAHFDSSLHDMIVSSLRSAMASGSDLSTWVKRDWPQIEKMFAANGDKASLLVETSELMGAAAGQYAYDFSPRRILAEPYWMYLTMADDRVRPGHRELHGRVFRKNDRFAQRYLPPWAPNCRCYARSLSESDMASMGVVIGNGSAVPFMTTAKGKQIGLPNPAYFNRSRVEALVPDEFSKSSAMNDRRK